MPKNFYTLLILPKKHSSAKKVSLSGTLVTGVSIFTMGLILFVMYFSYDYIHIRREQAELGRLKQKTVEQEQQIKEKKSLLAVTPSIWPVVGWVTSEFGRRPDPFGKGQEFHKGLDIATKIGRPVQAPADGVVTEVAYHEDVGNMIQIDHGHGVSTFYGHLSKSLVRMGAPVKRGDRIGYVGNSGRSTGSHLHYAVLLNGVPVNPRKYVN